MTKYLIHNIIYYCYYHLVILCQYVVPASSP